MVLSRFSPMEAGKRANAVPWYVTMNEEVRTELVGLFREEPRQKKKRSATQHFDRVFQIFLAKKTGPKKATNKVC